MPRGLNICLTCSKEIGKGQRTEHLKTAHGITRGNKPHKEFFKRADAPASAPKAAPSAPKPVAAPTPSMGQPIRK